ncbi:restriction endonuclease subunit S [Streptomyces sp. NPDC051740]|uniref:restriction endonuclease subunit S n=1 Tax=Streptomyces sp. NPDC051740 TaxID=3365673 RepID=UPI003796EE48
MSGLPSGWVRVNLDEIAEVQGGIQKQQKRRPVENKFPFLRVANVGSGTLDLEDVHEVELFEGELERFVLRPGDLLVVEGNGSVSQLGRAARWSGEIENCVHQNHLIRVRPGPAISAKFLELLWNSSTVSGQLRRVAASTSGLHTLSTAKLKRVSLALPPLEEQWRIVAALEEQLSRLDAAVASVHTAKRETTRLLQSIYDDAASGRVADGWRDVSGGTKTEELRNGWMWRTPSDLTDGAKENIVIGPFGSNLKVSDYEDSGVPLVFVRNIRSGNFKSTRYVSQRKAEELKSHSAVFGDLLITKMGEPPGDAAAYREVEDGIVTADCIRLRPSECWNVDYLAVAVNSTLVRRQIEAATRGVAQRKVSLARFRDEVRIPVPPENLQVRVMGEVSERVSKVRRLQEALTRAEKWAEALRRSLLAEAFAGRLVSQNSADEPAEALLTRIRAEREAAGATKPRRRSPRRAPAQRKQAPDTAPAPDAPPQPRADAPALATATQPTLDLEIPS